MSRRCVLWLGLLAAAVPAAHKEARAQQEMARIEAGEEGLAAASAAVPARILPAFTTVKVDGNSPSALDALTPAIKVTQQEILSSAGTFGDFSRYLQVMPGVVWSSDLSNDVLVRGGHPTENLFVIDGVEVPNINHFSLAGTNGGFAPMLDSTAVGSLEMRPDVYDVGYSSRLSSLIEIHTRGMGQARRSGNISMGLAGAGGLYQSALGRDGKMLLSAHRSILNLVTNDIGINGVPAYTNALARIDMNLGGRDAVSLLNLSGADSIKMTPCNTEGATSKFQTQYAGWRTTGALTWRHDFRPRVVGNLTASTSTTRQQIGQQEQIDSYVIAPDGSCHPAGLLDAYNEDSRSGLTALNYEVRAEVKGWLISGGAGSKLVAPDAMVTQPSGQLSPFSADSARTDAVSFRRKFVTGEGAGFVSAEGSLGKRWKLLAGLRVESFAIVGGFALDPRISAVYELNGRQSLHASFKISSQLPPMMDLFSYESNRRLRPTEARQAAVGMRLWQANWGTVDAEAYRKSYRHEAVAMEYPALMLANMVDTLGQGFTWLPLASSGTAQAEGVELAVRAHWRSRTQVQLSASRSRETYRALDGIRRFGNYDAPLVVNVMGNIRLPVGLKLDLRESYSTGRPYTPFDLTDSIAQKRGIFDLTRVNALRGPDYNRLDVELERRFRFGRGALEVHAGAENVLNRGNLAGYAWLDNCPAGWDCNNSAGLPIIKVDQMGRYPVLNARWEF